MGSDSVIALAVSVAPVDIPIYAAALAAALYLGRLVRSIVHKVDQINDLTSRELEHNHGGSMKADVHGVAIAVGELQRDRDEERQRINAVLGLAAAHHPDAKHLYLALLRKP